VEVDRTRFGWAGRVFYVLATYPMSHQWLQTVGVAELSNNLRMPYLSEKAAQ